MTAAPRPLSTAAYGPIFRRALLRATGLSLLIVGVAAGPPIVLGWRQLVRLQQAHPAHLPDFAVIAAAGVPIQLHLLTLAAALALTGVLMLGVKGSRLHRTLGWTWSVLMLTTALATLFIRAPIGLPSIAGFGPLHIFAVVTLIGLPRAVLAARRHNVRGHASAMSGLVIGGLGIAGLFAFLPGRLLWQVFFA
jgi:uncharacterized membrane protein